MNAGRIKLLADEMAGRYFELSIPTDELYKSIAQSNYWKAKGALHASIDVLDAKVKNAFYAGYNARSINEYLLSTEADKEWKKYNNED